MNKQVEIQKFLAKKKVATISEILKAMPFFYYSNGKKHIGEILSRMVKNGKIKRLKKGTYAYISHEEYLKNEKQKKIKKQKIEKQQLSLF